MYRGMRTIVTSFAIGAVAIVGLTAPAQAGDRHDPGRGWPDQISLPDGFQPEGIATDGRSTAWFGSRLDGDVYRADLRTGKGRVIAQGPGTPSLGMKLDRRGRLFVAGGTGGDLRVLDGRSGRALASYQLVEGPSFINDVVLTDRAAYVTDSSNAQLFVLPLGRHGTPPRADQVSRVPLTGDWQQIGDGVNANGLVTTPDRRALLVVNSANGVLYRVDVRTGRATAVDTGGDVLTNGDGLLREGSTLYVVQNRLNKVAVLRLDRSGHQARPAGTLTSPTFDVPTTVARAAGGLYLPNARFTTTPTPTTPYSVTRIRGSHGHR